MTPSQESLASVLRAIDALPEGDDPAAVDAAVLARNEELAARLLQPVSVVAVEIRSRIAKGPALPDGALVDFELTMEDGGVREGRMEVDQKGCVLPTTLPAGYHHIRIRWRGRTAESHLLATPRRAFRAPGREDRQGAGPLRDWGVFLPLHALRTARDRGVGDLTDLERLLEWVEGHGGGAVGVLPLFAAFLDRPLDPSPYAPASRLFWNELHLDPERLPEWGRAPAARERMESQRFQSRVHALRAGSLVDYREAYGVLREMLGELAAVWQASGGEQSEEMETFLREYPDARDYARFRAVVEARGTTWGTWAERRGDRDIPRDAWDEADYRRHLYAQLRFHGQLSQVGRGADSEGAGLYLDLPLGSHPEGFDSWAHRDLFARGPQVGAPPDLFQEEGQRWGLAPVKPEAARRDGHSHFRAMLGRLLPHARFLRVDHVMGLHRLFWIPEGLPAREGVYVRYPAPELYATLSIESHRHRVVLVGEDLGTVPREVRRMMDSRGVRRMFVVPFELDPEQPGGLAPVPPGALATLNTHDLPTFAAEWADEQQRSRLRRASRGHLPGGAPGEETGIGAAEALQGLVRRMGESAAGLVMLNLEDLWLEEEPQNRPGVPDPGNWRRRAELPLEAFAQDPGVLAALETLRQARAASPREGPASPSGRSRRAEHHRRDRPLGLQPRSER